MPKTRKDALLDRYQQFVAGAVLAAHANQKKPEEGFRQRDVKFLIELFSNWVESSLNSNALEIQNTQVSRYLENLVTEGYARRISKKVHPRYQLTRTGVIELTARIAHQGSLITPEHFFFLNYFIHNYQPKIISLVQEQGKQFPLALKLELEELLDWKAIIKSQLTLAKRELQKLEARIADGLSTSKLAISLFRQGRDAVEVAMQVEKAYPYGLNSRKTLSELFSELPADTAQWELEVGCLRRVKQIWEPSVVMLKHYIDILAGFLNK